MTDQLIAEIKKMGHFSEEDIDLFLNVLEECFVPKGEHFLKTGQVSNHIGYLKTGLMMHYKIIDGNEIPVDFAKEQQWVAYLKSFSAGLGSDMGIKALEDTYLYTLSRTDMGALFVTQPKFMALRSYYTELSFVRNNEHATNLATLSAKERYYKFVKDQSDLHNRIPQYLIAAYLGIKPQSLSRLRK